MAWPEQGWLMSFANPADPHALVTQKELDVVLSDPVKKAGPPLIRISASTRGIAEIAFAKGNGQLYALQSNSWGSPNFRLNGQHPVLAKIRAMLLRSPSFKDGHLSDKKVLPAGCIFIDESGAQVQKKRCV